MSINLSIPVARETFVISIDTKINQGRIVLTVTTTVQVKPKTHAFPCIKAQLNNFYWAAQWQCGNKDPHLHKPPHLLLRFSVFSFLYISLFFVIFPNRGPETCFSCKTLTLQRVAILHFPLLFKTPPPHVDLFLTSCLSLSTSHIFIFAAQTNLLEVALPSAMVDRKQPHQVQVHGLRDPQQQGPSASKVLAVLTMLPVGGGLLALAGITLVGTLIGLTVTTPLFILFSPVLVPAALLIGFAATSFLASGALGLTGFRSLSWVARYVQEATRTMPESLDQAKRRMQDMAGYVGQRTKEVGQEIQRKAHEGKWNQVRNSVGF